LLRVLCALCGSFATYPEIDADPHRLPTAGLESEPLSSPPRIARAGPSCVRPCAPKQTAVPPIDAARSFARATRARAERPWSAAHDATLSAQRAIDARSSAASTLVATSISLAWPAHVFVWTRCPYAAAAASRPIDAPSIVRSRSPASSIARRASLRARDGSPRARTRRPASMATFLHARPCALVGSFPSPACCLPSRCRWARRGWHAPDQGARKQSARGLDSHRLLRGAPHETFAPHETPTQGTSPSQRLTARKAACRR
jgi:hypothetical protein